MVWVVFLLRAAKWRDYLFVSFSSVSLSSFYFYLFPSVSVFSLSSVLGPEPAPLPQLVPFSAKYSLWCDVSALKEEEQHASFMTDLLWNSYHSVEVMNEVIWHEKSSDLQRATFMVVLADYNVESYLIITLWLKQFLLSRNQKCEGLRLLAKME